MMMLRAMKPNNEAAAILGRIIHGGLSIEPAGVDSCSAAAEGCSVSFRVIKLSHRVPGESGSAAVPVRATGAPASATGRAGAGTALPSGRPTVDCPARETSVLGPANGAIAFLKNGFNASAT